MKAICSISGWEFEISEREIALRNALGIDVLPDLMPHLRIRHIGAFWPHWSLHKRMCDKTGRDIISVFRPECPYPVWHKDEWYKSAEPPQAPIDFDQTFFSQAERLFKKCPIPHNSGTGNENCEYTDDWWFGRNCYLCHCGVKNEDNRYCYRLIGCKNSLYCVFSFECEWCFDVINSEKCFQCIYGFYLKNCRDTAFCYDCRNCQDCLFCFNLRNKQYCIGNKQLSREEYEIQKQQFPYDTQIGYQRCKDLFWKMLREIAWHKSNYLDFTENCSGNYLLRLKNMSHTFFGADGEDWINVTRFWWAKTATDSINLQDAERIIYSSGAQVKCYDIGFSFMLDNTRFARYSAYSSKCENVFGCCGLLGWKNAILNTPYAQAEYEMLRNKLIGHMKSTGEWGHFFPGSFAPNPYDEGWGSFYFPLSLAEQKQWDYFSLPVTEQHDVKYHHSDDIPSAWEATETSTLLTYWDESAHKPFQILPQDINFCRKIGVPLPQSHYMRRLQENFAWMPYNGVLRKTKCAQSWVDIETSWSAEYDGRILSEAEYLKKVW